MARPSLPLPPASGVGTIWSSILHRIVELERFATLNLLARVCAKLEVILAEVFPKSVNRKFKF